MLVASRGLKMGPFVLSDPLPVCDMESQLHKNIHFIYTHNGLHAKTHNKRLYKYSVEVIFVV